MRIGSLVIILHLACRVASAATPSPPLTAAQIQSVTHDARTPLSTGKRVTVRLLGTPGGVARFHIPGVATGVGMREIRSSRDQQIVSYVGVYVIRPGDAARAAAIIAMLKVGEQEFIRVSDRPVTIDARPPQVTERQPQPNRRLTNLRPNIVLRFYDGDSGVNPSRVTLVINGQDVTSRTAITDAFAAYTPPASFRPGPIRVQAVVRDRSGNTTRTEWTFAVARPSGLISSVTVSPAAGLKPGDYLTVVMVGAPAGRASLTARGSPRSIPMRESAGVPGMYSGAYPVPSDDQGGSVSVSIQLRKGNRSSTASTVAAVPVFGRIPRPIIVPPAPMVVEGELVIERIEALGRSRPALHVMGLLSARVETSPGSALTPLVATSTSVRQDGSWRLSLGPFVPWPGAEHFLTVVAIDPLGQRSPPVTVALGGVPRASKEPPQPPVTGGGQKPSAAGSPEQQSVPAPSPPQSAVEPAPCSTGQIDPATGLCVAPPADTGGSQAGPNQQAPASDPPATQPPSNPTPAPPSDPAPPPEDPKPEPREHEPDPPKSGIGGN